MVPKRSPYQDPLVQSLGKRRPSERPSSSGSSRPSGPSTPQAPFARRDYLAGIARGPRASRADREAAQRQLLLMDPPGFEERRREDRETLARRQREREEIERIQEGEARLLAELDDEYYGPSTPPRAGSSARRPQQSAAPVARSSPGPSSSSTYQQPPIVPSASSQGGYAIPQRSSTRGLAPGPGEGYEHMQQLINISQAQAYARSQQHPFPAQAPQLPRSATISTQGQPYGSSQAYGGGQAYGGSSKGREPAQPSTSGSRTPNPVAQSVLPSQVTPAFQQGQDLRRLLHAHRINWTIHGVDTHEHVGFFLNDYTDWHRRIVTVSRKAGLDKPPEEALKALYDFLEQERRQLRASGVVKPLPAGIDYTVHVDSRNPGRGLGAKPWVRWLNRVQDDFRRVGVSIEGWPSIETLRQRYMEEGRKVWQR